jgi:hypothetical protein
MSGATLVFGRACSVEGWEELGRQMEALKAQGAVIQLIDQTPIPTHDDPLRVLYTIHYTELRALSTLR